MIRDFYSKLKNDATLATLLGADASDSKIYPTVASQDKAVPYIVYNIQSEGTVDELIDYATINVSIYGTSELTNNAIYNRLRVMLDNQDNVNIPSTDYRFFWCKLMGGDEIFEPETRTYHRVMLFDLKTTKKENN